MRNNIFAVPLFEMECDYKEDLDSHIYSHIEKVKSTLSNNDREKFNCNLHGYTSYYGPNLIDLKPFQPLLNEIERQVIKDMNTDISIHIFNHLPFNLI